MDHLHSLLYLILHIDQYLNAFISSYGAWTYLALGLVIFCETGLVVTPFLPGDSLLFAAGSLAAQPDNPLEVMVLLPLLLVASVSGNLLNYLIGGYLGPRVFTADHSWLLNKKHLAETHNFYEKHGGKTLILARFLPIIRTFAPFIAGIAAMPFATFMLYNLVGALLWIASLLCSGYFLGSLPMVKEHFSLVVYGIIAVSLIPAIIAAIRSRIA